MINCECVSKKRFSLVWSEKWSSPIYPPRTIYCAYVGRGGGGQVSFLPAAQRHGHGVGYSVLLLLGTFSFWFDFLPAAWSGDGLECYSSGDV